MAFMQGDRDSFRALVERYESPLVRFCRHMLGNEDDALDAAQDTFMSVLAHGDKFKAGCSFRAWFFRIARNRCIDAFRSRKSSGPVDDAAQEANGNAQHPGDGIDVQALARTVKAGMQGLDPDMREALSLRFLAGMSYKEMAEATGQPMGTIASRVHRGLERIAGSLAPFRSLVE